MAQSLDPTLSESQMRAAASQMLECIICLQPAASPIYQCLINCHFTCGNCYSGLIKVNGVKCALCSDPLTKSICAERLSRKYGIEITCPHEISGCNEKIVAVGMENHLKNCEYRNIGCVCHHSGTRRAVGCQEVQMKDFASSWNRMADQHFMNLITKLNSNTFRIGFFFSNFLKENCKDSKEHWDIPGFNQFPPRSIEYDNHAFVLRAIRFKNMFHWWLLILGGQKDADKYKYRTKILLGDQRTQDIEETSWTLPVLPFHKYELYSEYNSKYATCSGARIGEFHINRLKDSGTTDFQYSYNIEIEILRTYVNGLGF